MRLSLLNADGAVVNVVLAGEGYTPPDGLSIGAPGGEIGDTWDGSAYVKPAPPPEPAPTAADFAMAVQSHIDDAARGRGYNDSASLASYVSSTLPQWAAEASAFVAWRDAVWIYAYGELGKVQAGQRALPTIDKMIAELPKIDWPAA